MRTGRIRPQTAAITEAGRVESHALSSTNALQRLNSNGERGLSTGEAERRLTLYGPNELPRPARASALRLFAAQFTDLFVLLLLAAIVVSLALEEWLDTGAIGAILVLNAALGFAQEYRAERALEALERLAAPLASVIRDGEPRVIEASRLVPGDIIQLSAGDIVPADGRLIASEFLQLQEASLTGESLPGEKQANETLPVAIPLQRRLGETARWLIAAALSLSLLLFIIGLLNGQELGEMFLTAVAMAVAAVPEGLPAAVTIVLALGVQRMVRRHVIVRRLESVETLGTTAVICTDKTGTLTQNRLTVKELFIDGETITLDPGLPAEELTAAPGDDEAGALGWALLIASLCNESGFAGTAADLPPMDPVERALVELARSAGFPADSVGDSYRLHGHIPFDSDRKIMTAVYLSPRE